jgi:carbohydrate-selective porin OprB
VTDLPRVLRLLDFGLKLDLEKAFGWRGASLSTTWLLLSGKDASEDLVGNFLTISEQRRIQHAAELRTVVPAESAG